jgi:HD-like signal output (HDOD) protein
MAVQGSLSTLKIPELFSLFHQLRKTGILSVVSENEERGFLFCKGNLVYATTKDSSRRLGSFLARLGMVTVDELNSESERPSQGELYFGQRLVENGRISKEQLSAAVREQILDMVEEVLTWTTGAFHLDDKEPPFSLPQGGLLSTHSIILEAAKRSDEKNSVKKLFPDLNLVLAKDDIEGMLGEDPLAFVVFDLVDGQRTVEQILFASPAGTQKTVSLLHGWMSSGVLRQAGVKVHPAWGRAVPELHSLPVAPDVPGKLFAIFNQEEPPMPRICEVLSRDPMLAAKVLRALTLKGVELARSNVSIAHLVTLLGAFQLKSILIPEAIRGLFFQQAQTVSKECWEHSLVCAQLCQQLALWVDYPFPDEAYLAGLLHNLGAYILMNKDPTKYREVIEKARGEKGDLESEEEKTFGISHTKLGGTYAEKWNFPKNIVMGIKFHHKVDANNAHPLLNILSVANGISQEAGVGVEQLPSASQQLDGSLKKLGLRRKKVLSLLHRVPRALSAVAQT